MEEIKWEFCKAAVEPEEIKKVEELLGVAFPEDYITCVTVNDGGCPSRDAIIVDGEEEGLTLLFRFGLPETDALFPA